MPSFADLAQFNMGMSTSHYLYLNDATETIFDGGEGQITAVAQELEAIPGNSDTIEGCSLPEIAEPRELLLHLSQSTAYHRRLSDDVRLATAVMSTYHRLSGMPLHERLVVDVSPIVQPRLFDPRAFDPVRGMISLWSAFACIGKWGTIPASTDAAENVIDLLQTTMHLLVGGIMTLSSMAERIRVGGVDMRLVLDWFEFMENGVFYLIGHNTSFVHESIHDLWSGAAIAAASKEEVPLEAIEAEAFARIAKVIAGIDMGLESLSKRLFNFSGTMSARTGASARTLRESNTIPLLQKIERIGRARPPQGSSPRSAN